MSTTPLAQRLYDKTEADLSAFRNEIATWQMTQISNGFDYSGSAVDAFWQMCRNHLKGRISYYFEWLEKEGGGLTPSSLRRDSVHQCVGAIVSYSDRVRRLAIEKNKTLQKLDVSVDLGRWDDVDESFIVGRGTRLLNALGVGPETPWTERLNYLSKDHQWVFNLMAVLGFLLSVTLAVFQVLHSR